jgi:DNA-binding NarL/FixJ family response regulator
MTDQEKMEKTNMERGPVALLEGGHMSTGIQTISKDSNSLSFQELLQLLNQVNNGVNISIFFINSKPDDVSSFQTVVRSSPVKYLNETKSSFVENFGKQSIAGNVPETFDRGNLDRESYQETKNTQLTQREGEILHYMAKGYLNKQIALTFGVSEQTVKNQVTSILRKLGAESRTGAVANAVMKGIISFPERVAQNVRYASN